MNSYDRHQEVSRIQARQKLVNCALLVAYVYGQPGGWYGIAAGHIDGFTSDYALIHSNPGNIEVHAVRAFYLDGDESYLEELEQIRAAVRAYNEWDELPLVTTLTEEEKAAAVEAVREAISEEEPDDVEEWIREVCKHSGGSDLGFCDWSAVASTVKNAVKV